jgi:hypothetical protein
VRPTPNYFLIPALCLFLLSCKSQKVSSQEQSVFIDNIEFSFGGGITGKYQNFTLSGTGEIVEIRENGKQKIIKTLDKEALLKIDKQIKFLVESGDKFNDPGNFTYTLTVNTKSANSRYVWNDSGIPEYEKIDALFNDLLSHTK